MRFDVGTCSLGAVLVAGSADGVRAVHLGDDADELVRGFSSANPEASAGDLGGLVPKVVALVESPWIRHGVRVDARGTDFQKKVWAALLEVPPGETSSYSSIAAAIGRPGAQRAVAQACGANEVAVLIPCHRAVRSDGGPSGYRWGEKRKAELLRREAEEARADG